MKMLQKANILFFFLIDKSIFAKREKALKNVCDDVNVDKGSISQIGRYLLKMFYSKFANVRKKWQQTDNKIGYKNCFSTPTLYFMGC